GRPPKGSGENEFVVLKRGIAEKWVTEREENEGHNERTEGFAGIQFHLVGNARGKRWRNRGIFTARSAIACTSEIVGEDRGSSGGGHKLLDREADKNAMLPRHPSVSYPKRAGEKFPAVALELLAGCGMIFRASSRTSLVGDAGHYTLRFRLHYSLIISDNQLNLFAGSYV